MKNAFRLMVPVTVRWGDMDALGHVNNAAYFTYFEVARIAYFSKVGVDERWTETRGPILANAHCNFKRAITYPSELEVGVKVSELRNSSFQMEYAMYEQAGDVLLAEGSTTVVWVDYKAGQSLPLPSPLREAIENFEKGDPAPDTK